MHRFRTAGFLLWLALAFGLGQHAMLAHDVGHFSDRLAQQDESAPASSKCEQHLTCAQLASAVAATPFEASLVAAQPPRHPSLTGAVWAVAPRLGFHSRAPPPIPA